MTEVAPPQKRRLDIAGWWQAQPKWTKVMFALSAVALVGGAIWSLASTPATGSAGGGTVPGTALVPGQPTPEGSAATGSTTSAGVFRLGFSFVAGYCIGAFLRTTARFAAVAFGFWLVMTLLLAGNDLLTVNWTGIDQLWDRFWGGVEWNSFERFLTGSLPAAGLASVGLYAGLRKRR
jgi:uncharacterized membrane protein (Fun14 family)